VSVAQFLAGCLPVCKAGPGVCHRHLLKVLLADQTRDEEINQEILAAISKGRGRNAGDKINLASANIGIFSGCHLCQSGIGILASVSVRYRDTD
jgi:hypothetical protein